MGAFLLIFFTVLLAFMGITYMKFKDEHNKVNAMSPDERAAYTFGPLNTHLVCPHCQTKGLVRAMRAARTVTSTGKVGGILKTDTKSQTTTSVTQHHCDQCGTTWDV